MGKHGLTTWTIWKAWIQFFLVIKPKDIECTNLKNCSGTLIGDGCVLVDAFYMENQQQYFILKINKNTFNIYDMTIMYN